MTEVSGGRLSDRPSVAAAEGASPELRKEVDGLQEWLQADRGDRPAGAIDPCKSE